MHRRGIKKPRKSSMAAINILKKVFSCRGDGGDKRKGLVKVWVGRDKERVCKFEMKLNYLHHPLFMDILRLSTEEFGYSYGGALKIACEIDVFLQILQMLERGDPKVHYMELRDFIEGF